MDSQTSQFPEQPRVLIADDTSSMREVLADIIAESGYQPLMAEDGRQCLEVAVAERPDLILLDIRMPGDLDGFATMVELKNNGITRNIPVIFLTGQDNLETKIKGFELGAVDFISKPFYVVEVKARLRLHLKLSFTMNALVHAQQQRLGQLETAQRALLVNPEDLPEANFAVRIRQYQEAGGDYYEVIPLASGQMGYFVADIAGHDVGSGFLSPAVKALIMQNCTSAYTPMESMTLINNVLVGMLESGKFLTAVYLVLDRVRGKARIISMGHPPVILRRISGEVETIGGASDVLGAFEDVLFEEREVDVVPGDRFYLYSDGLIEGGRIADLWIAGIDKLADAIRALPCGLTPEEDIAALLQGFDIDVTKVSDDLLLMCVDVMKTLYAAEFQADIAEIPKQVETVKSLPAIRALCDTGSLACFDLSLMLYEALNNAVLHGCRNDPRKKIKFAVMADDTEVLVRVEDEGDGFDFASRCRNDFPNDGSDSGRGILLLKNFASRLNYQGRGNIMIFTRKLERKK